MMSLNKRIIRNFKDNLGKYLAIFILLFATISFGSAFLIVSDSTEKTLKSNQEEKNIEDGNFTLDYPYEFNDKNIEENFYINLKNNNTLRVYKNRININQLSVFTGKIANKLNEISLDRTFAQSNNIKLNDTITYEGHKFKVVGFVSVPDCTSLFENNNDLMMNTTSFGIGFVTDETFDLIDNGHNIIYNYSFIGDEKDIKKSLLNNENVSLNNFLPRRLNQSITFLETDMGTDVPSMKILICIVIAIIAFVFVVMASNNIEQDAKSIGTLKALGYKNSEIIRHYMLLPIIITLIAAIFGNILGYTLLIEPFKDIFYTTYSLPPMEVKLNPEALILTTIVPIILMLLINYFSLKSKIGIKTIDFLRNNIRKNKTRTIKLSDKLKFKTRFRLRVISDNLINFIVLFVGIYLASLILIFGVGLIPIIENYEEDLVSSAPANYQYMLKTPVKADAYSLTQYKMKTYFKLADKDIDIMFMGLSDKKDYFDDIKLYSLDEGIVISDTFAKKFDVDINDEVKFYDDILEKEYTFKVLDVYEYHTSFAVFVSQHDLNKLLNLPDDYFNSYLSEKKLDIDEIYINNVITREDLGDVASQMLDSFKDLLQMVNVFAIVIYLVLMYVLTKIIIEKNSMEISLLKVLGYNKHEVKKLYLNATTISVIIILLLVQPLEALSIKLLMKYVMIKVDGYMEAIVPIYIYVLTIIAGILSYLVVYGIQISKINKIPMQDALKERE